MNFTGAMELLKDFSTDKLELSYGDLWERLIGKRLSEDEGRKRYYGAASLLDLYETETTNKDLQLIRDERAALKNDYRKMVRFDRLEDIITRTVNKLSPLEEFKLNTRNYNNKKVGILQLSDWHYGLIISNVANKYDSDEAYKRIENVMQKTIEQVKKNDISKLYLFIQGDLISGNIHNILRLQNQEDLIEQIIDVAEILAVCVNKLSVYSDINIVLVGGNHERVTPKKDDNLGHENYIKLIEWYLRERLKFNSSIDILRHQDYDSCYLKIFDFNVGVVHGDKDKPNTAPDNLRKLYGVNFDFIFTAHNHYASYTENGFCRVICNGSLCGTDDYAKDLRLVSYATQNFSVLYQSGEIAVLPLFCKDK